jgi:hypothetical protein
MAAVVKRLSRLPGWQQAQQPHGQLREIALRGDLGRAARCRADALVSGRARAGSRALAHGSHRKVRSMAL